MHCSHCIFNSLTLGRLQIILRKVVFQEILVIDGWRVLCKIVLKWMPMDLTDGKSTLVQVMAWCRQATSHYLSQCWPRSVSPYGIIRPQWVNTDLITWSWMLSSDNTIYLTQPLMSNNWLDDNHKFTWPICESIRKLNGQSIKVMSHYVLAWCHNNTINWSAANINDKVKD